MELSVTQENLARALSAVSRVASTKAGLPILGNILLRTEGNRLLVAATNLEIASTYYIGAKIIKQEYKDDYFKHFYNITLTGKINPDFNPNCKKISEILTENIYYANIINKTLPDISLELIASEISLKGIFVQKMLQKINITENIEEKDKYEKALYLGLKSFEGEISFYEDK